MNWRWFVQCTQRLVMYYLINQKTVKIIGTSSLNGQQIQILMNDLIKQLEEFMIRSRERQSKYFSFLAYDDNDSAIPIFVIQKYEDKTYSHY